MNSSDRTVRKVKQAWLLTFDGAAGGKPRENLGVFGGMCARSHAHAADSHIACMYILCARDTAAVLVLYSYPTRLCDPKTLP